ncbi:hypothetical protein [Flavobacterium ovatum]|uniref:hypothetical protein n=1 Tax=Flavobacterium ovatum TaxID=1928857 RepID=UPI00344BFC49
MNLEFKKRRWDKNEAFKGNIWIIDDFYKSYKDCKVKFEVKDDSGNIVLNKNFSVNTIDENSAKSFFSIDEKILKTVKSKFSVNLELTDKDGKVISKNDYFFLIGDQDAASKGFKEWKIERLELENKNGGYGSYYHYFKELDSEENVRYESGTQTPKAKGF